MRRSIDDAHQFDSVTFDPSNEERIIDRRLVRGKLVGGRYNMWTGLAVQPRPGTNHERFLEHVHKIICGGNDEYFESLLNWMARVVQEPGAAGEVAVVLRGKEGTGKGFYAREYGRLFGRHYLQVTQTKHLVGHFNDHLRECVLLFADEAFFAGDKAHASQLKALITEKWMMIEPKGVNAFAAPNFTHIIMASNDKWTVPAGPDARRYCVLDVSAEQMRRSQYFEQMQARGRQIICSDTGSPVRLLFRPSWQ